MGKGNFQRSKRGRAAHNTKKIQAESIGVEDKEGELPFPSDVIEPWPCLLLCSGTKRKQKLTLFDLSDGRYITKVTKEMYPKNVCWTNGEWLVLQNYNNLSDCSILNVLTLEKVQLPPLDSNLRFHYESSITLSSSPTDANCILFYLSCTPVTGDNISVSCQLGAKEFSRQEFNLVGNDFFLDSIQFQGKLYALGLSSSLFCAELDGSQHLDFEELINGKKVDDLLSYAGEGRSYLIECGGEILFFHHSAFGLEINEFDIYQANLCEKKWEKIKHIGDDRAIFVDYWRGFSASTAGCEFKGNCIYYIMYGTVYVYDLEDESILTLSPFPFSTRETDMRWVLLPTSIER